MSEKKLHTRMRLWEFPDEYVVEPIEGGASASASASFLSISRSDGSITLFDEHPNRSSLRVPKIRTIYGVVGLLTLFTGSYLFVIMERECVGSYLGHPIFRVSSLKILPCDHSLKTSPSQQKSIETQFSGILNAAETTHGLFFSYNVNLTLSMQRLHDLGDETKSLPLWKQADPRFMWNNYMMEGLIEKKLDPYLLPILQGSFNHFQAAIGTDVIDVTLIARRCMRRTGTRMWRRGANPDGDVANFVESEQIIHLNGYTAAFVEIRGTMPFLWEQIVDLKYKPKFEIVKPEKAREVAERHFLDLKKRYGSVVAVDLVNKNGGEGYLCEMYRRSMLQVANDDIKYIHFDFHKICGHIHFERLSILYDQISDFLETKRYFLLNDEGERIEEQHGVVRTNCIDCLDRTNVTQSMIGRKMLECQLRRIGVFGADETISQHSNFDDNYKILWANHGDDISIQYSGTPALKGDFVRFGKRTTEGILNDGFNALARYYYNNFRDGTRQDAIDLVNGHFIVSVRRDMSSPHREVLEALSSLPAALCIVLAGVMFTIMSLGQARYELKHLYFSLVWAILSLSITAFVRKNGRAFCNRPRLHKP